MTISYAIDAVDLKNVLRKINTDCDNFVHGRLLISLWFLNHHFGT